MNHKQGGIMNKREMLEKMLRETVSDPMDAVLPKNEWKHVACNNMPFMQISEDFCGMTLVARWIRTDVIKDISREDMIDMLVGADGRSNA